MLLKILERDRAISNLQTFIIIEEDQKNLALCYVVDEMLVKKTPTVFIVCDVGLKATFVVHWYPDN